MRKYTLCLVVASLCLFSCKKYHCPQTLYCGMGFNFVMVGYTPAELDTVVIRVYRADGTFRSLLDTAVLVDTSLNGSAYTWQPLFGTSKDSLLKLSAVLSDRMEKSVDTDFVVYDWEVYIKRVNKTFRIWGMKVGGSEKQTVETCDSKGNNMGGSCSLYLSSFTIDGKTYNFNDHTFMKYYNFIFLKK